MEAGETFPFIINLTPKGAACVIEGLAAKSAAEGEEIGSLRYENKSLSERMFDIENRVRRIENAKEKGGE